MLLIGEKPTDGYPWALGAISGMKNVLKNEQVGKTTAAELFFENGTRKYVGTCTALVGGGKKLDGVLRGV
jgi:hypothetical protein